MVGDMELMLHLQLKILRLKKRVEKHLEQMKIIEETLTRGNFPSFLHSFLYLIRNQLN